VSGPESRAYQVFDPDGTYVGEFATWWEAHEWAHRRAAELPGEAVEIDRRAGRLTWVVHADCCELVAWTAGPRVSACPLDALAQPRRP
jgi:hypothetical protein